MLDREATAVFIVLVLQVVKENGDYEECALPLTERASKVLCEVYG
jgi:hypothetical protein